MGDEGATQRGENYDDDDDDNDDDDDVPVEEVVEPLPCPDAVDLAHALNALEPEAEQRVDVCRLVVASNEVDVRRVLDLEGQKQTNGLEGVCAWEWGWGEGK